MGIPAIRRYSHPAGVYIRGYGFALWREKHLPGITQVLYFIVIYIEIIHFVKKMRGNAQVTRRYLRIR